ncbi:MAG: N-acetylmuramoyl-L-alanine amidase [Oscillospiraceae bacterium]|nr:N-acetylmuramoyl-L-alanine amidase [Oscillospiraceae bacterium]
MIKKHFFDATILLLFSFSLLFLFICKREIKNQTKESFGSSPETVIIDPGHGGDDGGAVANNVLFEKDFNLKISQKLELLLNLHGVNTDMTRREDISLGENSDISLRKRKIADIRKRVNKILSNTNATVISVHQNSYPQDTGCFGAQVFYSDKNVYSKLFAKKVQDALKYGINNANSRTEKVVDRKIFLLEQINCPAVLVECGFLTNADELAMLSTEEYQMNLAACIASGFFEYKKEM